MVLNKEFHVIYSDYLKSIIFDYLLSHEILTGVGSIGIYKVFNKKGSVKKRKTSIKRSGIFEIALKGGENRNFAGENFDHSVLL